MLTLSTLNRSKPGNKKQSKPPLAELQMGMPHLVSLVVEIDWFATLCMAHLLQNGCLSGVGVTDDQNPKALDGLFEY
jgi:hypothetical protein